jgi:hypothetical protein
LYLCILDYLIYIPKPIITLLTVHALAYLVAIPAHLNTAVKDGDKERRNAVGDVHLPPFLHAGHNCVCHNFHYLIM